MPLNIKSGEAHRLARRLADVTDTTLTEAVTIALREAIERREELASRRSVRVYEELAEIAAAVSALPVLDDRSVDEMLGYQTDGIPGR
jgi:antitoxin VapB